jgi:murein DD-endopeptidase MepM/ murein hydrolase activator NlpD
VAKVSRIIGEQLFPERQLLLQSSGGVRHLSLPGWLQAMVLAACIVSVGGIVYLAVGFAHLHDALDTRVAEVRASGSPAPNSSAPNSSTPTGSTPSTAVAASASNPAPGDAAANTAPPTASTAASNAQLDELRQELAQMRQQLATVTQNYADANARASQAHDQVAALSSDNTKQLAALTADNGKLHKELDDASSRIKAIQDARDDALARAKTAELAAQAAFAKTGNVSQLAKSLEDSKTELQQSEAQRTTLQNRVQQLQMELQANGGSDIAPTSDVKSPPPPPSAPRAQAAPTISAPTPPALPAVQGAVPAGDRSDAGTPHAQGPASELENLLASTGIDINHLLDKLNPAPAGQGGPYIALNGPQAADLEKQRLDDLKQLAKVLPLAAPLNSYQLESGFGARVDPINRRASFHPGLDLAAPYMSPVYSTGPGIVIFTGTMDSYGRVVEIDHGHGIVTRYAHLHRILVARGQKVGVHVEIGELGSTGRSTGPHVHYEVHVNGSPVDPAKFMEAGRNVVQISGK